jgi:hypothetical protein
MSHNLNSTITVIGIDIRKNSFHVIGLDGRGGVVLRQKWSSSQVEARLANMRPCLIGMEACVGAHHLSRKLKVLGHEPVRKPSEPRWPSFESCGLRRRPASRRRSVSREQKESSEFASRLNRNETGQTTGREVRRRVIAEHHRLTKQKPRLDDAPGEGEARNDTSLRVRARLFMGTRPT